MWRCAPRRREWPAAARIAVAVTAIGVSLTGCTLTLTGSPVAVVDPPWALDLRDPAETARLKDFAALDPCGFLDVEATTRIVGDRPYDVGLDSSLEDCELRFDESTSRITHLSVSPTPTRMYGGDSFTRLPIEGVDARIHGGFGLGGDGLHCSIAVTNSPKLGVFFSAHRSAGTDPRDVCDALTDIVRAAVPRARDLRLRAASPFPVTSRLSSIDMCGAARFLRPRHPRAQIPEGRWWSTCRIDLEPSADFDHGIFVDAVSTHRPGPPDPVIRFGRSEIRDIMVRGFRAQLRDDGATGCKGWTFVDLEHPVARREVSYRTDILDPGKPPERVETIEYMVEAYETYSPTCSLTTEILDAAVAHHLSQ